MKTKLVPNFIFLALLFFCLSTFAQAFSVPPGGQAVVADEFAGTDDRGAIFLVDVLTGQRTVISDFGNPIQGPLGQSPVGVALQDLNTAFVININGGTNDDGELFRVDLITGQRTLISDFGNPAQGPIGSQPAGLALDGLSAYVVDDDAGTDGDGALFHVNLNSGQRTIISDFGDPAEGPTGGKPQSVALYGNGSALVTDEDGVSSQGTLFLVDLTTGQRTVISDFGNPAQGPIGLNPFAVILDPSGDALVTDEDFGDDADGALLRVDLTSGPALGDRTLISDFGDPAQGPTAREPQGIAFESPGQVLIVEAFSGADDRGFLFKVDTISGDRTIVSDFNDPSQGPLGADPTGVAFRPAMIARPIPTLSEWGLIATAGILGLAGLYAAHKRRFTV